MIGFIDFLCALGAAIFVGWFFSDIKKLYKLGATEGFDKWTRRDWHLLIVWALLLLYLIVTFFTPL